MKRAANDPRKLFGIVDLDHPLGNGAEEMGVIKFLSGLASARRAADLPDQEHHGSGIVSGAVQRNARISGARSACHDANTGRARCLGIAFGHKRCAAFLPIGDELDLRKIDQTVDDRDIAFAWYAENMFHSFVLQTLSYRMAAEHRFPLRSLVRIIDCAS